MGTSSQERDPRPPAGQAASFAEQCGASDFLHPSGGSVPPDPICLFPEYPDLATSPNGAAAPARLSTGSNHVICIDERIVLISWGKPIELTRREFESQAGEFRRRLIGEGALLEDSLRSMYKIQHELRSEHWFTYRVSHLPGGIPDIEWLKSMADRVRTATDGVRGGSIDPHQPHAAGLEFYRIRLEEKDRVRQLQIATSHAAGRAEDIVEAAQIIEEASFEILKAGNKIYALNNPIRQAAGEIAIAMLRGGVESLGAYLAYEDRQHVLEALHHALLRDVPPILKNVLCASLGRAFALRGAPTGVIGDVAEIYLRAHVNFFFELLNEALKDHPKFDDREILRICTVTLESALVELISRVLFGKRATESWNAKLIAFNVLGKMLEPLTNEMFAAKREAEEKKKSFVDVFLGRLPGLIVSLFKIVLVELVETGMKQRWPEDVARKEWENAQAKVRENVKKLGDALRRKEKEEPDAPTVRVKPVEKSPAVARVVVHAEGPDRKTRTRQESTRRPRHKGARRPADRKEPTFETRGMRTTDVDPSDLKVLVDEVRRDPNLAARRLSDDRQVKQYVNSADFKFERYDPKPEWTLYKLVPKGSRAPLNSGWYLSEHQLNAVRAHPELLHSIYGALPDMSKVEEYEIYSIRPHEGAIAFRAGVASSVTERSDQIDGGTGKVINPGGRLKTAPDREGGGRMNVETEQIIVPNGSRYSAPVKVSGTIRVPMQDGYGNFARELDRPPALRLVK